MRWSFQKALKWASETTDPATSHQQDPGDAAMNTTLLFDAPVLCERLGDRLVLTVSRDGAEHPALTQQPLPLDDAGITGIDVDMAQVAQANSVIIGWLVRLVSQSGKPVRLLNTAPRVALILRRMNLHTIMSFA